MFCREQLNTNKVTKKLAQHLEFTFRITFGVFGVSSRFTELRDLGVIYEKGIKKCSVTGRNVIEWDLTDRLPIKFKNNNKTKKQKVNDAINSLRVLYQNKDNSTNEDWKIVADLIKTI